MCLGVYSDVPLQICFLKEQVWCESQQNELRVQECYDIVLRNHGSVSTDKLMFLSPHLLYDPETDGPRKHPAVKLPSFGDQQSNHLNWYMKHDDILEDGPFLNEKSVRFLVPAYMMPGSEPIYHLHECIPLNGEVRFHKALRRKVKNIWESFLNLNCTFGEILLDDPIKPYNKGKKSKTTYCIRIVFEPVTLNHRVGARKLSFQDGKGALWVQPCEVLAPPMIFYKMRSRLEHIIKNNPSDANKILKRDLADNGFLREKSIVWIEDHRVSVITAENGTVVDTETLGAALPSIVQYAGSPNLHAWTWHAGSRHFPKEDAFIVSEQAYKYFHERARYEDDAKTVQRVASDIGFPVKNVRYAINMLVDMEILAETKSKYYLKNEAPKNYFSYDHQAEIRMAMAKPQHDWENKEISFPGKSFLIQFAFLWSTG